MKRYPCRDTILKTQPQSRILSPKVTISSANLEEGERFAQHLRYHPPERVINKIKSMCEHGNLPAGLSYKSFMEGINHSLFKPTASTQAQGLFNVQYASKLNGDRRKLYWLAFLLPSWQTGHLGQNAY